MKHQILTLKDISKRNNIKIGSKELHEFIQIQERAGFLTRSYRLQTENNDIFDLNDQEAKTILKTGKFIHPETKQQFDMLSMDVFPVWKE